MIKAVIFDMYETLITHYKSPLYFGSEMAKDAGMSLEDFFVLWRDKEIDDNRTKGQLTLEEVLERIFKTNDCYSKELVDKIVKKRMDVKRECFKHLHPHIVPMLRKIKEQGIRIGLISNCYSEEVGPIKESELYPYFDVACLSYEVGMKKPDEKIYLRCMEELDVEPEECLYVGDGGSDELEGANKLGIRALQATWYMPDDNSNEYLERVRGKDKFAKLKDPLDVLEYIE